MSLRTSQSQGTFVAKHTEPLAMLHCSAPGRWVRTSVYDTRGTITPPDVVTTLVEQEEEH